MFLALEIQHAPRMRHIIICDASCSTMFFPYYLTNGKIFQKKKVTELCFDFLQNFCPKHFTVQEEFGDIQS